MISHISTRSNFEEEKMKNPRRISLSEELMKLNLSTEEPPPDSLFWKMWNSCTEIANEALETPFIQGIKLGNLDPIKYGGFNVSDAYYCFNGAQDYLEAESATEDETLRAFLLEKYNSYQKYNEEFPKVWHIRDARGVVPIDVCKNYSEFESNVASHEEPIYCIVVMIPCEYLWYWLANQLAPPGQGNLYAQWITENDDPTGAYALGNFLNDYQKAHPGEIDEEKAIQIYTQAMTYEKENFRAATE